MDEQPWGNSDVPMTCFRTKEYSSVNPYLEIRTTYPPSVPIRPEGETFGKTGVEYNYTTYSVDPDGAEIYYKWDWGDGNFSDWLPTNTASHAWQKGCYEIRVKAMDCDGAESWGWSEPSAVKMPYSHNIQAKGFFEKILQRFQKLSPWILSNFQYITCR
jgi:hypothetical protein